ncbi:MAG TPA: hypothetical protein VLR94_08160, partial [Acidobacteriota bacterium]|nr:hypothetical protein [Acidobacteriota bacterium]
FLMEAAEIQADQILVVSREGHSNLYFVSGDRVRRLVKLCSDITQGLAVHIADRDTPAPTVKTVPIKILTPDHMKPAFDEAQNHGIGECVTVALPKPSADVNCTMPMPALKLIPA